MTALIIIWVLAIWVGIQNALTGGGAFLTLPTLMLTGMTVLSATITTTVAQFLISIYGGYFGCGIGFLMLATSVATEVTTGHVTATMNVLAGR